MAQGSEAPPQIATPAPNEVPSSPELSLPSSPESTLPTTPSGGQSAHPGSDAPPTSTQSRIKVLNEQEQPISDAKVEAADGRSGQSTAQGLVLLEGSLRHMMVRVEAPGYAPSLLFAASDEFSIHLRKQSTSSEAFNQISTTLRGHVLGASGPITGGSIIYVDEGASLTTQSKVEKDGRFSLSVMPQASRPGRGSLMVLVRMGTEEQMVALRDVQLGSSDQDLGALTLGNWGPKRGFKTEQLPAVFNGRQQAFLVLQAPGKGCPIKVAGTEGQEGELPGPPSNMANGWRSSYEFQAQSSDGQLWGQHRTVGHAGGSIFFSLLAPPQPTEGTDGFTWNRAPGAQAYHSEARLDGGALAWERMEGIPSPISRQQLPPGAKSLILSAMAGQGGPFPLPRLLYGMQPQAFRVDAIQDLSESQLSSCWVKL